MGAVDTYDAAARDAAARLGFEVTDDTGLMLEVYHPPSGGKWMVYKSDLGILAAPFVRDSLARIRAVVEAQDAYRVARETGASNEAIGDAHCAVDDAADALTPDDRRLLGMDR